MGKLRQQVLFLLAVINLYSIAAAQESEVAAAVRQLSQKITTSFQAAPASAAGNNIAVMDFSESGDLAREKQLGRVVSEILTDELGRSGVFRLAERMRLNEILHEQELAQSGLIDSESAVQVGGLLGARAIVSGSVMEAGKFYIVTARMVDSESGEVLLSESVEIPQAGLIALSERLIVQKKYAIDAVYRSIVMPGWGQFYNDQPRRGYIFLGAAIAAGAAAAAFDFGSRQDYDSYQRNTENSVVYFDQAVSNREIRDGALVSLGGIWVLNTVDAFIQARRNLRKGK